MLLIAIAQLVREAEFNRGNRLNTDEMLKVWLEEFNSIPNGER